MTQIQKTQEKALATFCTSAELSQMEAKIARSMLTESCDVESLALQLVTNRHQVRQSIASIFVKCQVSSSSEFVGTFLHHQILSGNDEVKPWKFNKPISIGLINNSETYIGLIRQALSEVLLGEGDEIFEFRSGRDVLNFLEDDSQKPKPVDLFFFDIGDDVVDSKEAFEHVKSDERFRNIPAILTSPKDLEYLWPGLYELGGPMYILESVGIKELVATLKLVLHYWKGMGVI